MLGVGLHLSPITGSGWGFFWPAARRASVVSQEHMCPQRTVTPGIATGAGAALNGLSYGMGLGVARAELFHQACVTPFGGLDLSVQP